MTLGKAVLGVAAAVAFLGAPRAHAQMITYGDPFWTPNVITGLPPALYPAGWYLPGFGAHYGIVALSPGYSYLCRTYSPFPVASGWFYGHVYAGTCYFPWSGAEYSVRGFEILGGARNYSWYPRSSREASNASHVEAVASSNGAQESDQGLSSVCRAEVNYGKITGQLRDGNCHVAFEGVEIIRSEYEVLRRDSQ